MVFAVVNTENRVLGVIHCNDIIEIIISTFKVKYTSVKDVMKDPMEIIYPVGTLETVMYKFESSNVAFQPVLKNGKYYGFISKSIALEAYRSKLKSMTIE